MMAHASSAGAPFDSEVSNADLDSEAFATTPSATTPSTTSTSTSTTTSSTTSTSSSSTTEAMDLDMLTQLLDSSSTTEKNCVSLLSDPSVIAMSTTSSTWDSSPSISPLVLKLESPLLSNLADPDIPTTKPKAKASTGTRKRSSDPHDKEAKARERVLRNRAAAQESRDKKRKYVSEIEASNESLQQENSQLLKRLKTVENDNLALSQRLETLTAQFAQMQQLLSQSVKQNQPGTGFCQSAVLAKKDKKTSKMGILTNSPQQKLVPSKGSLHRTTSNQALANNHRQTYSMTMKTLMMSKKEQQNKEARLLDQSAAQNRMEISCRSAAIGCNQHDHDDVGVHNQHPATADAELFDSFLDLDWSTIEQSAGAAAAASDSTVIEEIVTEFRQGHKDVARGLLVKALLLNRYTFYNNKDIKRKIILLHKK
ncbi:hypothetical protein BGZ76_008647 [Entomortierella beljakovae]|nr:hypothetical protein BGZ76_008647 [Entomortierella beljakovae]